LIEDDNHLVSQTAMLCVVTENSRLRHYLVRPYYITVVPNLYTCSRHLFRSWSTTCTISRHFWYSWFFFLPQLPQSLQLAIYISLKMKRY